MFKFIESFFKPRPKKLNARESALIRFGEFYHNVSQGSKSIEHSLDITLDSLTQNFNFKPPYISEPNNTVKDRIRNRYPNNLPAINFAAITYFFNRPKGYEPLEIQKFYMLLDTVDQAQKLDSINILNGGAGWSPSYLLKNVLESDEVAIGYIPYENNKWRSVSFLKVPVKDWLEYKSKFHIIRAFGTEKVANKIEFDTIYESLDQRQTAKLNLNNTINRILKKTVSEDEQTKISPAIYDTLESQKSNSFKSVLHKYEIEFEDFPWSPDRKRGDDTVKFNFRFQLSKR
jgi:hypothetical protein